MTGIGFKEYLNMNFGAEGTEEVCTLFSRLSLPIPKANAYMQGTEGALVFLNDVACVLRIEESNPDYMAGHRIEHPHIIQPLASFACKDMIVEICPGTALTIHLSDKEEQDVGFFLENTLAKDGVDYWDTKPENNGCIPLTMPEFPSGVPVVIDRLAVKNFTDRVELIRRPVSDSIDAFYQPLKDKFQDGLTDNCLPTTEKIQEFWSLCAEFRKAGKLVAGWNKDGGYKTRQAKEYARVYKRQRGQLSVVSRILRL